MKILIIGVRGLLGSFLYNKLKKKYHTFGTTRYKKKNYYKLDLNNLSQVKKFFKRNSFNVIINTSGLTDVDRCNKNLSLAKKFNTDTVKNLSKVLNFMHPDTHLIHFSTDQVYNNKNLTRGNIEKNVKVSNNYSKSKYLGELSIDFYKKKTILRTNFFGRAKYSNKPSFSDFIIKNIKKKKKIYIPSNIYFSPIHMTYIYNILQKIIIKKIYGTFNLGSSTGLSKYEFGKKIAKIKKLPVKFLVPYSSKIEIHNRPNGTILSIKKIETKLKIKIPSIIKSIQMLKN